MPKQKQPMLPKRSLINFLAQFDAKTLIGALSSFENSTGWELFQAYMRVRQREFEVASLDLVKHGRTHEAAHASGYAQAVDDIVNCFAQELKNVVSGKTGVVEEPMPEEIAA